MAVKFKERRWHKAGLTQPSLHPLKFNLSWERCHRSQGGTFNQSRLNSNAASQFEKREKYIKKGSNPLSWLFFSWWLTPLCLAASLGRPELEMWTFPPPKCKHGGSGGNEGDGRTSLGGQRWNAGKGIADAPAIQKLLNIQLRHLVGQNTS